MLLGKVQLMFLINLISQCVTYIGRICRVVAAPFIHTVKLCLWLHVLMIREVVVRPVHKVCEGETVYIVFLFHKCSDM
jgi:hypothetical protein